MKPILRNIGFWIGVFFQALIVLAVFLVGWGMSFTAIDLNTAPKASGTIVSISPEQTRGTRTISGQKTLVIHLDNNETGFFIYRASQNYAELAAALPLGSKATIYYSKGPDDNGYAAYQVKNSQGIVYSLSEYERKEKLAGRFIALPGSLILLGVVVMQIRKRYKTSAANRAAWPQ